MDGCVGHRVFHGGPTAFSGEVGRLQCLYFCSIYHFCLITCHLLCPGRQEARWVEGTDTKLIKQNYKTGVIRQLHPLPSIVVFKFLNLPRECV